MTDKTRIVQEIRDKTGITEEIEKQIIEMQSGTLGLKKSGDISIHLTNGYGQKCLGPYTNYFPWTITVHGCGTIKSPSDGTWRILIKVNGKTEFDQSNIVANHEFCMKLNMKGWSASTVCFQVWWSEQKDTTLKVHVEGHI